MKRFAINDNFLESMLAPVAFSTQRDQVLFFVPARPAAKDDVMDLQVLGGTTVLASPLVAFQHLPM